MILPGDSGPLLGAILLEDVGVLIRPSGKSRLPILHTRISPK
jgi:hypothetical protein